MDIGRDSFKITGIIDNETQPIKIVKPAFAIWDIYSNKAVSINDDWGYNEINDTEWLTFDAANNHTLIFPSHKVKYFQPIGESYFSRVIFTYFIKEIMAMNSEYPSSTSLYLSVPTDFSRQERFILQECCDILNIKLAGIVDESVSTLLSYVYENKEEFQSFNWKNVTVIDIGRAHTALAKFKVRVTNQDKILAEQLNSFDEDFGGSMLNKYISNKIRKSIPHNLRNKTFVKSEIQKFKHILSSENTVNASYFNGTYNFEVNRSSIDFQPLIESLVNFSKRSEVNSSDIIILTGGTTAFSEISDAINQTFSAKTVTLPNGACALGAALMGNATFECKYFVNVNSAVTYGNRQLILSDLTTLSDASQKVKMSVEKTRKTLFNITVGRGEELAAFRVDVPSSASNDEEVELTFGFDNYGIPNVASAMYREFDIELLPERPPWMLPDNAYDRLGDVLNAMDRVRVERRERAEREARAAMHEDL